MASTYMKLRIALFVFSAIGLILYIAAFAIPKWSSHKDGNDGLWQTCYLNGGVATCAVWPDNLKSADHKITQILSCLGLSFFILFVVMAALTIFWTNQWKKARAIKYTTVVLAVLAVIFAIACLMIYKNDKESGNSTVSIGWYLALVGAVIATITIPFYFVDACRTVEPKKPDKEKLFQNIGIPPMPAPTKFPIKGETDTFNPINSSFDPKNSRRPPLLNELRRQHTTFVHPPPKPPTKKLTKKEIKTFPLPPSKTKINLFDKTEIEDHPSPVPPQVIPNSNTPGGANKDYDTASTKSTSIGTNSPDHNEAESIPQQHSVFKFHKTKTVHKNGKTMLKIQSQNDSERLPPVMMVMPGVDEDGDDIDDVSQDGKISRGKTHNSQWDEEQARRKFGAYFVDMNARENTLVEGKTSKLQEQFKKKINSISEEQTKAMKGRVNDVSGIYTDEHNKEAPKQKPKTKKKSKKKSKPKRPISQSSSISAINPDVETCVNTYNRESSNVTQDGLTIHNELEEEDV
ncbi:uncharacterized protein LOC127727256 [Mytilus californianus]|uniref:uncharacterized protein LOC127727256 n=1 Tax=Mytilus californianus TaxID=6549 RepID=UPI0022462033|nr:uncharacterized protein LOC127727256 [Mytilus californianus]